MHRLKTTLATTLVHGALIVWAIYSVMPFIWAIIGSFQTQRDALAREPRYMPQFALDYAPVIAAVLALIVYGIWRITRTPQKRTPALLNHLPGLLMAAAVFGVFVVLPSLVPEGNTFLPTWQNYQELWLNTDPAEFAPVALGLIVLVIVLVLAGLNAHHLPISRSYVYLGIVATIVLTVLTLPNFVRFAEFYDFFLNSVIVTVGTVVVSITIGCLAGYGLARYSGADGAIILFVALAFRALPRMAFVLPYYSFAQATGLYDTYILVIITLVAVNQPFTIWLLRSFFMEIPRDLEEAAMIDGCSRLSAFVRVIIPIVWPGIITTALFTLLLAYNEFLIVRILTSTNWTLPVGISRFTSGEDTRYIPLSNASAVSITIPIVFLIIFFQRYLVKGLAGGAVKG